jgi:dolichyl-phosphate beta-glucosyltransferase
LIFTTGAKKPASKPPSQTIIIPAYNEGFRIERSLRTVLDYEAGEGYESNVLLVDDGSSDDTVEVAQRVSLVHPNLEVHSIPHGGKAAAVLYGLEHASGDLVLFTDADLATPISYLSGFREAASCGADVVIGSREGKKASRIGEPAFRHLMGRGFNAIVRVLLLPGIHDTQCGFKLFTAQARDEILSRLRLYRGADGTTTEPKVTAFDVELLVVARRLGLKIEVIPVTWTFGERSKVNPVGDTITNFSDVAQVKWNDLRGRYD